MKKFNFKVILVIVLSLALIFSFAACKKDDSTTVDPPTTKKPGVADYLSQVLGGLDLTINSLSDLTDRFEGDIEFYATVNEVDYLVSIKANVDISANADNDSNKLAIVVTKDAEVVFGLYYNGADEAIFFDLPSEGIKRYIDGFNLASIISDSTTPVDGGFASGMPTVSLVTMIGDVLDIIATVAFSNVDVKTTGTLTTYAFTFNAVLLDSLPDLFGVLGELLVDVELAIDDAFDISGFKLSEFTIPPMDLDLIVNVDAGKLVNMGIELVVPAFDFYINADRYELITDPSYTDVKYQIATYKKNNTTGKYKLVDSVYSLIEGEYTGDRYNPHSYVPSETGTYKVIEPIKVSALDLKAGINLKTIGSASTDFTVEVTVPTTETAGYTYFSPLNLSTTGLIEIAGDYSVRYVVKTDINPFVSFNDDLIADAKAFIQIKTWESGEVESDDDVIFELVLVNGTVYVKYLEEDVEKRYTLGFEQGMILIKDLITKLTSEESGLVFPDAGDEEEEQTGGNIDIMAFVELIKQIPNFVVDNKLTIDKAFVEEIIEALAIEGTESLEDIEITALLSYDDVDTDMITGIRVDFYMKNVWYDWADIAYTGTMYAPATFEEDTEGEYKLVDTAYVLAEVGYEGTLYSPVTFIEDEDGLYGYFEKEEAYYATFDVVDCRHTVVIGTVVGESDVPEMTVTLDFTMVEDVFEGFEFDLVNTGTLFDVTDINIILSGFTFTWSEAVVVTEAVEPDDANEYSDLLDDVTVDSIIAQIQDLIDKSYNVTK